MEKTRWQYFLLIGLLIFIACSERQENIAALERAKSLMTSQPDSSLAILDSLNQHEDSHSRRFRMQCRLHRQNAYNKLDTLFTSTEEAQTLADYFNGHGTPNEQMLAHYLLGRAYYDIKEAPMALQCYQTAAELADTTDKDCDFRQLSRVYGQMAKIAYQQNLIEENLKLSDLSVKYALKGCDTLTAILSMVGKIAPYTRRSQTDSALHLCEYTSDLARKHGLKELSAAILGAGIQQLIEMDSIHKAKKFIDTYEAESGYFDLNHNISKGKESYYYTKGMYYLAINKYDSANYYFRKELKDGKDFNNQNGGSRGLALLYQATNKPDSAAKYALYSYAMNDSMYSHMATSDVEQTRAMYDYTRQQQIAQQEKEKAESEKKKKTGSITNRVGNPSLAPPLRNRPYT